MYACSYAITHYLHGIPLALYTLTSQKIQLVANSTIYQFTKMNSGLHPLSIMLPGHTLFTFIWGCLVNGLWLKALL